MAEVTLQSHYFPRYSYMIEGFDMVGKTTFLNRYLSDHQIYHCNHDLTDDTIGRENSWTIGYGVIDFLEQVDTKPCHLVIDRGVFSSYVYSRIYQNRQLDKKVLDWYKNNNFFKSSVGHIYLKHHDSSTAEKIFDFAQNREKNPNKLSDKYDQFKSFNDYWIFYSNADLLFKEAYNYIGVRPRVFETFPDMTWKEVHFT